MAVAVSVRAKVTGQRGSSVGDHPVELQLAPGPVTASQLITAAVVAEVVAHEARADEATVVRVLTGTALSADLTRGAVRTGEVERPPEVDVDAAVATALLAFEDGIFKVFVGERELLADGTADLADGAQVLFLRLVPLAGG